MRSVFKVEFNWFSIAYIFSVLFTGLNCNYPHFVRGTVCSCFKNCPATSFTIFFFRAFPHLVLVKQRSIFSWGFYLRPSGISFPCNFCLSRPGSSQMEKDAPAGTSFSISLFQKSCFYLPMYTIRICTSLGFTPLMRLAWPRVRGRILLNFWRASLESDTSLV